MRDGGYVEIVELDALHKRAGEIFSAAGGHNRTASTLEPEGEEEAAISSMPRPVASGAAFLYLAPLAGRGRRAP